MRDNHWDSCMYGIAKELHNNCALEIYFAFIRYLSSNCTKRLFLIHPSKRMFFVLRHEATCHRSSVVRQSGGIKNLKSVTVKRPTFAKLISIRHFIYLHCKKTKTCVSLETVRLVSIVTHP